MKTALKTSRRGSYENSNVIKRGGGPVLETMIPSAGPCRECRDRIARNTTPAPHGTPRHIPKPGRMLATNSVRGNRDSRACKEHSVWRAGKEGGCEAELY
ncbi:hypothetical protein E2C01_091977 [Portunus trituberculatus]|uniref:Uncharacterized protein n=1 Tax=Portunus trituberculatus TaxID=210409 RepID=A0A5B7JKF0_PORTR|nr:hypothetical protein [Portunus trituberculatus]